MLGGGHAHVHVLREMGRERFAAAEVTLVTPFMRQVYSGMVPGVVAGHYLVEQAAIQLPPLAAAAGVHVVESAAVGLDAARRLVRLADGRTIGYDVLSLDTGSAMDRGRLPGARGNAIFVRPIEHFLGEIEDLLDAAAQHPQDVVVVGGGAAGVELALALQFRLRALGGGGSDAGRVALVLGGERPLAGYPGPVIRHAEAALNRARVTLFRDSVAEVRPDAVVLASGARVACTAPVIATGAEAPAWVAGSGLALDGRGFVVVGPTLQSGSHPEVFAAGDVASRIDAPHAKSGVYAVRAGPPLWHNLRAFCSVGAGTTAPLERWQPQTKTLNLVSCGARRAIASWGAWSTEGRWVWWWKNHIDRAFVARYTKPQGAAHAAAVAPAGSHAPGTAERITPSAETR
jgi:pyridine nucleotide-disulfide oxidoreductase family protein